MTESETSAGGVGPGKTDTSTTPTDLGGMFTPREHPIGDAIIESPINEALNEDGIFM
jgi:hypothetical protein